MRDRIILHIDMNSYFASVEQQANPFLRGKPVGVCAYLSPGGCIIASSIEAKAKGVKTGCKVRDAKALEPDIILLENEPAKYRSTTEAIFGILKNYTDTVEPYSIDEAFLDLSGWVSDFTKAQATAREIQARIKKEAGEWLESSVGISWTRFLAKFASDIAPKRSVLVLRNFEELDDSLRDRPLTDAWGINCRMEARLRALGIKNLYELKNYDKDSIRRALGRYGYYLWANVNGFEITEVSQGSRPAKSVGHSYCLPKKTADKEYLALILYKLCEKTGRRLRAGGHEAQVISVFFAYTRGGGAGKTRRVAKMFTTDEIFSRAQEFLDKTDLFMPVRMIAVSVGSLVPAAGQMSLFSDNLSVKELSVVMDRINDKYGEYTLCKGRMFGTGQIAKDRIGFRKSVEI